MQGSLRVRYWGVVDAGRSKVDHAMVLASLFVVDLASGAAVVVLTNGDAGRKVYEHAARTVFAREFDAFARLK